MPDRLAPLEHRPRTTTPATGDAKRSAWGVAGLALLPIACCGLPLLLAGIVAAGTGAIVGGVVGLLLLVIATLASPMVIRHRRSCPRDAGPPGGER